MTLTEKLATINWQELAAIKCAAAADQKLFQQILEVAFGNVKQAGWRAAWIIDKTTEKDNGRLTPHIERMARHLPHLTNSSQKRHFTRMLVRNELPETVLGIVVDCCFIWLASNEPAAVKVNSMQLIYNITRHEPELGPELAAVIESRFDLESKAFQSRGRKILKALLPEKPTRGRG